MRGRDGGVRDAVRERIAAVELGGVHVGEFAGMGDIEVEDTEDVQIKVDGVGEFDGAGAGEVDGAGEVTGDGVGQAARAGEVKCPEQAGAAAQVCVMTSARVRSSACA